jgi:glutaredoxin
MDAILYTRVGCHLCDDARELLENHGVGVSAVDIDADSALRERFNTCVPVVVIDGKVRFRGRVDPVLLRRLLVAGASSGDVSDSDVSDSFDS